MSRVGELSAALISWGVRAQGPVVQPAGPSSHKRAWTIAPPPYKDPRTSSLVPRVSSSASGCFSFRYDAIGHDAPPGSVRDGKTESALSRATMPRQTRPLTEAASRLGCLVLVRPGRQMKYARVGNLERDYDK